MTVRSFSRSEAHVYEQSKIKIFWSKKNLRENQKIINKENQAHCLNTYNAGLTLLRLCKAITGSWLLLIMTYYFLYKFVFSTLTRVPTHLVRLLMLTTTSVLTMFCFVVRPYQLISSSIIYHQKITDLCL